MDGVSKVAGALTSWRAVGAFVTMIAISSGGATAWAVTKLNSKADSVVTADHQDRLVRIEMKLDGNATEHGTIRSEVAEVKTDTREMRKMVFEIFSAGQKAGVWGTATAPSPPSIAQRGAP